MGAVGWRSGGRGPQPDMTGPLTVEWHRIAAAAAVLGVYGCVLAGARLAGVAEARALLNRLRRWRQGSVFLKSSHPRSLTSASIRTRTREGPMDFRLDLRQAVQSLLNRLR